MARPKSRTLTDGEHRIMKVLWERGSATVAEVAEALAGKDGSAYTTVLTMMRIMREKGYLSCRKDGRAHVFTPKVDQDTAARKAIRSCSANSSAARPGNWFSASCGRKSSVRTNWTN